ncbi:MAG: M64 family metallopeptidase [Phycisphaerales bacterium]
MNTIPSLSITLFAMLAGSALAAPTDSNQNINTQNNQMMKVHGCWGDEQGHLEGGVFFLPMDQDAKEIVDAVKLANRGAVDNRVDIVMVGDGYTAGEMTKFHNNATTVINNMFSYEPFISYEPYFRITQVEVVSNESGVDNDPQGVFRDTALDMTYWCSGIERLLCVSVSKAYTAASAAPDIDQVIAIANSNKYGGAGYPSNNLGTTAGGNGSAAEIAIHELGHSLGDLADEYTYGGPNTYTGPELGPVDVSIYDRTQQIAQSTKWYDWMDASISGFDNPISTYEGGNYSVHGVYRPSNNSMMRSLARPFNVVSAEQLLKEIYREVNPIDDGTPDGSNVTASDSLFITPMQPLNHDLQILWYLDDQLIISAVQQTTLDLSTLGLDNNPHTIRVDVVDPTPWVRDEAMRAQFMSESRSYSIEGCSPAADLTGDGILDFFDISAFLTAFNTQDPQADFNGDGIYDFFDVSAFLAAFSSGDCQ